jgi:hypothetical protein
MTRVVRNRLFIAGIAALAASASARVASAGNKYWAANTGTWSVSNNWSPNGMPSSTDTVHIGDGVLIHDQQVFVDVNAFVGHLSLTAGMVLDTKGHAINVNGTTTLGSLLDNPSRIYLRHGPNPFDLITTDLDVLDGSDIFLVDQPSMLVTGNMNLATNSAIVGGGVINFSGDSGSVFTFDGDWIDNNDLTLTLNQLGAGRIDLDGTTIGDQLTMINRTGFGPSAQFQRLTVNGTQLLDAYDDQILLGAGNSINMNLSNGWELGGNGKILFNIDNYAAVTKINGSGTMTVNGTIQFLDYFTSIDTMAAEINSPVVFNSSAEVVLGGRDTLDINGAATVNGGSFSLGGTGYNALKFNGPTKVAGGAFTTSHTWAESEVQFNGAIEWAGNVTIDGTARQNGNATVTSTTVINAETFDMDGLLGGNTWAINAPLTINADQIDTGNNVFNGTINVNSAFLSSACLTVNLPAGESWTKAGVFNVTGNGVGVSTTLAGSDVSLSGQTNVTYGNSFNARVDLLAAGSININTNSYLYLNGGSVADPNTIAGGKIVGSGKLRATDGHALVGYGTIATAVDFDGTAEIRAKDGTLTISGAIEDVGVIGTANDAASLNLVSNFNADPATKIDLKGGTIIGGATITSAGETRGRGSITTSGFVNNGSINANVTSAPLVSNTLQLPDLDGTSETGTLVVTGGNLTIADAPADAFNGVSTIGADRTLQLDGGWTLGQGGALNLQGTVAHPANVSGPSQTIAGAINVPLSAHGKFYAKTNFTPTAAVNFTGTQSLLVLAGDGTISPGATFTGPGTLLNAPGAKLTLLDQTNVGSRLDNAGTLEVGALFSGAFSCGTFLQESTGQYNLTLFGATPGAQFDRINVTNGAFLDGTLSINAGLYNPAYLVPHEIIHANGNVAGAFANILGVALSPTKYLAVTYDADSVLVTAARPGDANLDGSVNLQDFNILASHFGSPTSLWTDANFNGDGVVNLADFNLLAGNFGMSAGADGIVSPQEWSSLAAAVPEPGAPSWIIAAASMLTRRRRRRRRRES